MTDKPFRVGIYPVPGFALMSYACVVEPLRAANLLSNKPLYDVVHFGAETGSPSSGGATIATTFQLGETPQIDLLLVVAGGDPFGMRDRAVLSWLRKLARAGTQIGGVSGGAVILAAAGLLEGRRLTVHWEHAAALADAYPDLVIERRLYVIDRDRVTCGGGTSPLDLMHAVIADHHGAQFARLVSDWFLHTDIRSAGAPQRGGVAERFGAYSAPVVEALAAMESHVGDPLSLRQLAMIAGVSERQLGRLFQKAFGRGVMAQYRDMRLETARRLVRSTAMSVADIADATGFSNPGHLSNAYADAFGCRPSSDRGASVAQIGKGAHA